MSKELDFDPKDLAEPISSNQVDFHPDDLVEPIKADSDIKKDPEFNLKNFLAGQEQITNITGMGPDEISGKVGQALEKLPDSVKSAVSGANPNTDFNTNPQTSQEIYKQYRDLARKRYANAQAESPEDFLVGDLTSASLIPFGKLVEGAGVLTGAGKAAKTLEDAKRIDKLSRGLNLIQKEGTNANRIENAASSLKWKNYLSKILTGTTTGALEGEGRSEADLGTPQNLTDAEIGASIGGAIPLATGTITEVANATKKVVPKSIKDLLSNAYRYGQDGQDIRSQDFADKYLSNDDKLANKVSDIVTTQNQKNGRLREVDELLHDTTQNRKLSKMSLDNQKLASENAARSSKIEDETQQLIENQKLQQVTSNNDLKMQLAHKTEEQARHIQSRLDGLRQNVSDEYDNIYDVAKTTGVRVDTTPVLSNFYDQIATSGLDENALNKIHKEMDRYSHDGDLEQLKQLKNLIHKYTAKSQLPGVRTAAQNAYAELGANAKTQLESQGHEDLANQLKAANKKWQNYKQMDQYIEGLRPEGATGQMYGNDTTINAIGDLGKVSNDPITQAKLISGNKRLKDLWSNLAPVEELQPAEQLSQQVQKSKEFQPEVPSLKDLLNQHPEYQNIQSEQQALKTLPQPVPYEPLPKTDQEDMLAKFGKNPSTIKENATNLLPKMDQPFDQTNPTKRVDFLKNLLTEQEGEQAGHQFNKDITDHNIEKQLGQAANPSLQNIFTQSGLKANVFNLLTGGPAKLANTAGRMSVDPNSILNKFKSAKEAIKGAPGRTGVRVNSIFDKQINPTDQEETNVFDAKPNNLKDGAQYIRQTNPNPHAQLVADHLDKAAKADNPVQRNATLFSLLQDPYSRKIIKQDSEEENG